MRRMMKGRRAAAILPSPPFPWKVTSSASLSKPIQLQKNQSLLYRFLHLPQCYYFVGHYSLPNHHSTHTHTTHTLLALAHPLPPDPHSTHQRPSPRRKNKQRPQTQRLEPSRSWKNANIKVGVLNMLAKYFKFTSSWNILNLPAQEIPPDRLLKVLVCSLVATTAPRSSHLFFFFFSHKKE